MWSAKGGEKHGDLGLGERDFVGKRETNGELTRRRVVKLDLDF